MILSIFLAEKSGEAPRPVAEAELVAGSGIVGDRYYGRSKHPGQNVTFIESEAVAQYNRDHGQSIDAGSTRRNVVTQGVDLNALVGKEFAIGRAIFRGIERCEPCANLGAALENEHISKAQVVKAFLVSGGLRADVITSGIIALGMPIQLDTLADGDI